MRSQWPTIDELIRLSQENPEQLDALRQREIERIISSAAKHNQQRLRGLQFQIDCKRQVCKNPVSACVTLSEMMMDSLTRLNEALNTVTEETTPAKPDDSSAVVLPFSTAL
jgi:hypothetical protein